MNFFVVLFISLMIVMQMTELSITILWLAWIFDLIF